MWKKILIKASFGARSSERLIYDGFLNDIIHRILTIIDVPTLIELSGICFLIYIAIIFDSKGPNGLLLVPWKRRQALLWDATYIDTITLSLLPGA